MLRLIPKCSFAALILSVLPTLAIGGQEGTSGKFAQIQGVVLSTDGAQKPRAKVVLLNKATSEQRAPTSFDTGEFVFNDIPPGDYSLEASAHGFVRSRTIRARVEAGDALKQYLILELRDAEDHFSEVPGPFGVLTQRRARSETERGLIARAEALECNDRDTTKWTGTLDAEWEGLPGCINGEALRFYESLIKDYKSKRKTNMQAVKVYYSATARLDPMERQWVVRLRLEFLFDCGGLCGAGILSTRWVYFDARDGAMPVVDRKGCASGWVTYDGSAL